MVLQITEVKMARDQAALLMLNWVLLIARVVLVKNKLVWKVTEGFIFTSFFRFERLQCRKFLGWGEIT